MNSFYSNKTLNNNVKLPCTGFGTWKIPNGEIAVNSVKKAISYGYRHIDTASYYKNEESIGEAIKQSKINREDIFVTSKLWNADKCEESIIDEFQETLNKLQLEYLDLYLIHWPVSPKKHENWAELNLRAWRVFEKLYNDGKVKSIGVSNFLPNHLKPLIESCNIIPMVNQIEYHIGYKQRHVVDFCKYKNIAIEAWSPLCKGKLLSNDILNRVAGKYNKSVAQICIKWCLQNDIVPIVKSVTNKRIKENTQVFDFTISDSDMQLLNSLENIGDTGMYPDDIDP